MLFRWFLLSLIAFISATSCSDSDDIMMMDPDPIDTTMVIDTIPELYFPPTESDDWESASPEDLGWNTGEIQNLLDYLEEKNTKGFIILKDGKIVVEEYFNGHSRDANWEWFSAAKSLTSTMVGVAVYQGLLDIDNSTSTYLGDNWSSLTQEKQELITVRNHITMTTGLVNDPNNFLLWTCTAPVCMQYQSDAGTRWAYHQGAFIQAQNIITQAAGQNFKVFNKEQILDKIGMNGGWTSLGDVNIFRSTTRSMARFGLLSLNKGLWDEERFYSESYHDDMTNTSQQLNKAYGYLWWLNGKQDFLATADQTLFDGPLIPNAPDDLYCALGLNDQKIYVVPSENLVIIRMGESAGAASAANSSFDNELWGEINKVIL